jgi:cytochrome c biogenesis protein CcmG, thiol:disulfide interchange protein DsbE
MARISPVMIAPPLIFGAFILLAGIGMLRDDPNALPSARLGQSAPPVVLTELPSKPIFDDATLRDGKVKIVNYWASWCAPCRVEHPQLLALAREGLPIYGVNYKDDADNALAFLDELIDPYVGVGQDIEGKMAIDWGVYGIPETFILDGEGTVLLRYAGPMTKRIIEAKIRPVLDAAMANNRAGKETDQ